MPTRFILGVLVATALPGAAQAADCLPEFVDRDYSVVVSGVEIESGGQSVENFQVRVGNASVDEPGRANGVARTAPCDATILVARSNPQSVPGFPAYSIRALGNQRVEILPDPSLPGALDGGIRIVNAPPGPRGRAVPFTLDVSTEWGLTAGTYVEQLELLLLDETGTITDRTSLTITIDIPASVSLRLVGALLGGGADGPALVDLGDLSNSEVTRSSPFGARIWSTSPYIVQISSANRGNLLKEQGTETIPYSLTFDAMEVDLMTGREFFYPVPTTASGVLRNMGITVQPVTASAGEYSDRVTVSVSVK